jgi:hypothetical protein
MDTERFEPAGPWHAFDGRRPPYARPDKGPPRGELHTLARADAPPGVHAGRDEKGHMGVRTQPPIGPQHISCLSARRDRLHVSQVVGEERRDDQLEKHPAAGMEQPQEPGDGKATPRPWLRRLAKRRL